MFWSITTTLLLLLNQVQGHGVMYEPKSRNYRAWKDVDWNNCLIATNECRTSNVPLKHSTPHGLNNAGNTVRSQCGVPQEGGLNYDFPLAWDRSPLNWRSQAVYQQGSTISIKVGITAYHKGYFEFYACPRNQPITEACFKQNPLTFVQDKLYGTMKDSNFPVRASASPLAPMVWSNVSPASTMNYEFLMKLPNGISGDALIQWIYVTDNGTGERFWNCAEVTITGGPVIVTDPKPVQPPVAVPIVTPISKPVVAPVNAPVSPPITSGGTCGGGNRGNGICPMNGYCCSQWGYCGTTADYCKVSTSGTCGGGQRGDGLCPDRTLCCSKWGWCGTGSAFCGRLLRGNETTVDI